MYGLHAVYKVQNFARIVMQSIRARKFHNTVYFSIGSVLCASQMFTNTDSSTN